MFENEAIIQKVSNRLCLELVKKHNITFHTHHKTHSVQKEKKKRSNGRLQNVLASFSRSDK